jgi:predicted small lipoprotein YifL
MLHLKQYFLAILASSTLFLAACGQTGDLYLPEDEPEKTSKEKSKI